MNATNPTYKDWRGQQQPIVTVWFGNRRLVTPPEPFEDWFAAYLSDGEPALLSPGEITVKYHDPNPTVERVGGFLNRHSTLLVAAGTLLFVGIPAIAWLYTNGLGWGQ